MPRFKSLLSLLTLITPLLTGTVLFPVESMAQDEALSPAVISQYSAKLADARNLQADIRTRVACLDARDAELSARRDKFETALGDLRRREEPLIAELNRQQEQQAQFRTLYDTERDNYDRQYNELVHYQQQKYAQEEAVRRCKRDLSSGGVFDWLTDTSCDLANSIAHLVGAIQSVEGRIDAAEKRLRAAQEGVRSAEQKLDESRNALIATQEQSVQVRDSIRDTEHEIFQLKSTLSELRNELQVHNELFDDFANALEQAQSVDTADARARTARKIARISTLIDEAVAQSQATIDRANSILPANWRQSCAAQ